jgi:putative transferase (TIGR04331 family)
MLVLIASRLNICDIDIIKDCLMGPFCLPLPSDNINLENDPMILSCPWKDSKELDFVIEKIGIIYNDILQVFSLGLNQIHKVDYPMSFWKILIGPWLNWIINVIYDKYYRLLQAKKENVGELFIEEKFLYRSVQDTFEFVSLINHDESYNSYIISQVAEFIGYPKKIHSKKNGDSKVTVKKVFSAQKKITSLKEKIYNFFVKNFYSYSDIHIYQSGHSSRFLWELFLRSKGKIVEIQRIQNNLIYPDYNNDLRKIFSEKIMFLLSNKASEIYNLIGDIASQNIPRCWLEGFNFLCSTAKINFEAINTRKIVSSIGWYCDEVFKLWAATCALKGAKLIGIQHGGNYGVKDYLYAEEHEISITHEYFTWGWHKYDRKCRITPSPAQKLLDIKFREKNIIKKFNADKILYIVTPGCRFLIQFPTIPELFSKYHVEQEEFLSKLPFVILKKLTIRLHLEDNIWEIEKRLSQRFKNLKFENWNIPFRRSIIDCKIIICDHLSTTFIEVLASNIPIILFWNNDIEKIKDSARPYFDNFEKVGILHKSGKSAANFLSNIEYDVYKWWSGSILQQVVQEFCNNFAKKSKHPVQEWCDLLIKE